MMISVQQSTWGLAKCALSGPDDSTPLRIVLSDTVPFGELDSYLRSELVGYAVDENEAFIYTSWLECQLHSSGSAWKNEESLGSLVASGDLLVARIVTTDRDH